MASNLVSLFRSELLIAVLSKMIDLSRSSRTCILISGCLYMIPFIWWCDIELFSVIREAYFS